MIFGISFLSGFGWRFSWLFETGRSNDDIRALLDREGGRLGGGGGWGAPSAGSPACSRRAHSNIPPACPVWMVRKRRRRSPPSGLFTLAPSAIHKTPFTPFLSITESKCRYFYKLMGLIPQIFRISFLWGPGFHFNHLRYFIFMSSRIPFQWSSGFNLYYFQGSLSMVFRI